MKLAKILFLMLLFTLSIYANKVKDYKFINTLVFFTLKNDFNMSKEVSAYVEYIRSRYELDKVFLDILDAKTKYARYNFKRGKEILLSIPVDSKYYYNVNEDLYNYSTIKGDTDGIKAALFNFFKKEPSKSVISSIGRKQIKKMAGVYLSLLNGEGKKKDAIYFKRWLKENGIIVTETSDVTERIRHWESVIKIVNEYEDKYFGRYEISEIKIDEKELKNIKEQIKIWEAEEKKEEDLVTLMILMEIARLRVIIGEYKTAERLIADNFDKLRSYHVTVFYKYKDLSPLLSARYVLGLCYLIKAKNAYSTGALEIAKSLLIGGGKLYKNGAAQNFYFILREKADSYYQWKAFDRYEYATLPKVKKWFKKDIPSLVTSKTYGLENIDRLIQQQRYDQLLKNASSILALENKFSFEQRLEVYKNVFLAHLYNGEFEKVDELMIKLEKIYAKNKEEIAKTYQYAGKISFEKRKSLKEEKSELSAKYQQQGYKFFEHAYKINPHSAIVAELIYFLATDQYSIYSDDNTPADEKVKAIEQTLHYANIIINDYPSYNYYTDTIYWVAGIYNSLYDDFRIDTDNKNFKEEYKRKTIRYYKLYLEKSSKSQKFRAKRVYSLYALANSMLFDIDKALKKDGYVFYADLLKNEAADLAVFNADEIVNIKNIKDNIYIDEKSLYEAKINQIETNINYLEQSAGEEGLLDEEYIAIKHNVNKKKEERSIYIKHLVKIINKALNENFYKENQEEIIFSLAGYYVKLRQNDKAEQMYQLLSTKYPYSELTKSIVFRDVGRLIAEERLIDAVEKFETLKDELLNQDDIAMAQIFSYFYYKDKPYGMTQEIFEKLTREALFCAQERFKRLSKEKEEEEYRNNRRFEIALCYYNLKNYNNTLQELKVIIDSQGVAFYQALLLKGRTYKALNKHENAFQTYGKLYEFVEGANIEAIIAKQTQWNKNEKEIKYREFTARFVRLKFISLISIVELAYQLENYKKALFYIAKFESKKNKNTEGLEKFYETSAAIKILSTAKLNPNANLLSAIQQFTQKYPDSKWLAKIRTLVAN